MVEFKVGDRPRLMEINGRVWGSLPLAVFSGMDFPGRLADLYWQESPANTEPATDYAVGVRAFNLNLIASWIPKVVLGKRSSEPHLSVPPRWHALAALWGIFSVRQRLDILTWDDPRPGLAEIVKIARKLARWRRRCKC